MQRFDIVIRKLMSVSFDPYNSRNENYNMTKLYGYDRNDGGIMLNKRIY